MTMSLLFPVLFDLTMSLQFTETHNVNLNGDRNTRRRVAEAGSGAHRGLMPFAFLDLCLFVPCFPAFFDLLISLGQQGTHNITLT